MPIITTDKKMRPRDKRDFYPTPRGLVRAILEPIMIEPTCILDIGAGHGIWGEVARELWPDAIIIGIDPNFPAHPVYNHWYKLGVENALIAKLAGVDMVMGNPPYILAEQCVRAGLDLDAPVYMLLRLAFLEGQKRSKGLWKQHPPAYVRVLGRRPSFTRDGKTDATAYAVFEWNGIPLEFRLCRSRLEWLEWDYDMSDVQGDR